MPKARKKILIINNSAWGIFNFRLNLANSILNNNHEVIFCFPFDNKYTIEIKKKYKCRNVFLRRGSKNIFSEILSFLNLLYIFIIERPILVCLFTIKPNLYGSLICRLLRVSNIVNITGLGTSFLGSSFDKKFIIMLYRFSLKKTDSVFFQNQTDLNLFVKYRIICNQDYQIIPGSGVDLKKFNSNFKIPNKKYKFLFIGRLLKDKGVFEYLEASKMLSNKFKNIEFHLIGPLDYENRSSISKTTLKSITMHSQIFYHKQTDDIKKFIEISDCIVLPSYREGMPRVILEAFAMKTNVIASNCAGCNEIVDDRANGLLCKPKSALDLYKKMNDMYLLSKKVKLKMAVNGRLKVTRFYNDKIVSKIYLDHIKNLTNDR